ncbi:MAG TPA: polysaccharide deacetylase family protein, partial [Gemmatimonadaceae bacterium]
RRLLIVCYHGVSMDDEHEWSPSLYVTQDRLRARLQALREGGYTILPLADATERLYAGTLPPRSVALTFDDGAVDFERRALPVLREFNAPATLYLTTYYCLHRLPVFDTVLSYVLWKGRDSGADLASIVGSAQPMPVSPESERNATRQRLREHAAALGLSAGEKDVLVARVAGRLGVNYDAIKARGTLQIMAPDTVRALPGNLVDVQLHTHRHRTPTDHDQFVREIRDNDAVIRELRIGAPAPTHFCYPSGDYHGEFFDWLRECKVQYATTCVPDLVSRDAYPLLLPRLVDTMEQSALTFEAWASGFAALLPKRRAFRLDPERLTVGETVGT